MKNLLLLTLVCLSVIFCSSCHNNRLKTNEKELAQGILKEEKEKKEIEKNAFKKSSFEPGNKSSGKFRLKEIRSIDPDKPPIFIDILGTSSKPRNFKLSDFATSVRYIKLQTPPDTSLIYDPFFNRSTLISNIKSDGEQIVFQGLFGLIRYNMQGEYQETIWKNKTGIKFYNSGVMYGGKDFFGVQPNTPISLSNGNLYYPFMDGPGGTGQVMTYRFGTNKNLSIQTQGEIAGPGTIPGDTLLSTIKNPLERFDWIYGLDAETWAGINQKWNSGTSGSFLVTYNKKGDTLCQFADYDRIVNFTRADYRHAVELSDYYFNGLLTVKQEYNDTVFRLVRPDRLLPVYIIDFGMSKVTFLDGLNPDFNLRDKYMLNSLNETSNYLFIRYTQNYDSPTNRKKNSVKFYNAVFDKKEGKLFHQSGFDFAPKNLINDIDGGMPFWPNNITPQGEMMTLVSGKMIKDYINSAEFKESDISEEKRQKQVSMASGIKNTNMIIIIVK